MPKSRSLSISLPGIMLDGSQSNGVKSPKSPRSPPPPLPVRQDHEYAEGYELHLHSPITSLPTPPSPQSPRHKSSKSLFTNIKANKSTPKIVKADTPSRSGPIDIPRSPNSGNNIYSLGRSPGSTPDLSVSVDQSSIKADSISPYNEVPDTQKASSVKSSSVPHISSQVMARQDKDKRKEDRKLKFPRLGRKGSLREEQSPRTEPEGANAHKESDIHEETPQSGTKSKYEELQPKTAPLDKDRVFRDMMSSTLRNRSADRYLDSKHDSSDDNAGIPQSLPTKSTKLVKHGGKEESGARFLSSIGNKAAGGLGRAAKGLAKLGRSGSTNEKDATVAASKGPYVPTIINLPLIEQTRITRISKRLQDCRDKTEYWMPALPWRCIDYLNAKAPTSEGIYRVPGSDRDVKHWEQRFDKEYDIDLLHPDTPIYDINTIGSMLKNWLRTLPDTIIPNNIQNDVQAAVTANGTQEAPEQAPQELKDALSNLPPFNYYLLFAITCHISLLNAHPETTKMNFNALRICLQPCLRISPLFFQWLVQDWRNCWQGCWTEKEYLDQEVEWQRELQETSGNSTSANLHPPGQTERSVSPSSTRDVGGSDRERPKTSHKEAKKARGETDKAAQRSDRVPTPQPLPASATGSQQQQAAAIHNSRNSMAQRHQHTSSTSSNRPPTAHAPLSTPFDAAQAAYAASQHDRDISSSGSSKPSVTSFSADGRSTPEAQHARDLSASARPNTQLQARPPRANSRDPTREHSLAVQSMEAARQGQKENGVSHKTGTGRKDELKSEDGARAESATAGGSRSAAAPQLGPMTPLSPIASIDMA